MTKPNVTLQLACGHTSPHITPTSPIWEHPETAIYCETCETERQINIDTQLALYESIEKQRQEQLDEKIQERLATTCPHCQHQHSINSVIRFHEDTFTPICPKCGNSNSG